MEISFSNSVETFFDLSGLGLEGHIVLSEEGNYIETKSGLFYLKKENIEFDAYGNCFLIKNEDGSYKIDAKIFDEAIKPVLEKNKIL